jgi:hypothetical protein
VKGKEVGDLDNE